jgi:hypothetical protein
MKMAENSDYIQIFESDGYPFGVLFGKHNSTEEDRTLLKNCIALLHRMIPNSIIQHQETRLVLTILVNKEMKEVFKVGSGRQQGGQKETS